ncbi:CapA family protein [Actinokineospora inagensis]|uniref:CapA family protein n=1 Tax=Actinokineospora inagensis TaxID=103730 RepID=UPI000408CF1F|nr:CapA family protein [Actinokineospora inagensis]
MAAEISIFAVGDVFIDRADPASALRKARDVLSAGDIVFGNCEGTFSDVWERAPSCGSPVVSPAAHATPLAAAGFSVMSLANNHSVDGGHAAMLTTRDTLRGLGIATSGAGADAREAREVAVVRRGDLRVGFLSYAAVFPHGYEARSATPGLAPLRAHSRYTPWELNEWNPGLAPRVSTEPFPEDVDAFVRDVKAARAEVDVLVASFHWGDFTRPFVLTDHERTIAHLAVDSGVDIVLGHHQHMLRGVEFHRGKPIYYGLGHYLFDLPNLSERLAKDGYLSAASPAAELALDRRFGEYRIRPRVGYPLLPFHEDSRMTGVAVIRVSAEGVVSAGFCPAVIDETNEPVGVAPDSPEGRRVVDYLRRCCDEELLATNVMPPRADSGLPTGSVQLVPAPEPTR